VIPRSTRPSPTNVGMSAAGRKTSAIGKFLTSAISRREWRWNCISAPLSSSRTGGWRRPSTLFCQTQRELVVVGYDLLLGMAKSSRSFKLFPSVSVRAGNSREALRSCWERIPIVTRLWEIMRSQEPTSSQDPSLQVTRKSGPS